MSTSECIINLFTHQLCLSAQRLETNNLSRFVLWSTSFLARLPSSTPNTHPISSPTRLESLSVRDIIRSQSKASRIATVHYSTIASCPFSAAGSTSRPKSIWDGMSCFFCSLAVFSAHARSRTIFLIDASVL